MRTIKKSSTGILRRAAAVLAIAAVTVMMMPFMTNVTGSYASDNTMYTTNYDVTVDVAFGHEAVAEHLEEDVGVNVLTLLCNRHLRADSRVCYYEAYAHTCGEYL